MNTKTTEFKNELAKLLNELEEQEDNTCQISLEPLDSYAVTLECNHKFNYIPLYNEICAQKFDLKTYEWQYLDRHCIQKLNKSGLDYYIRCPYCRNMQFGLLPFYPELNLNPIYGLNSLDSTLPGSQFICSPKSMHTKFYRYGVWFEPLVDKHCFCCSGKQIAKFPDTDQHFCAFHYKLELNKKKKKQAQLAKALVKEKQLNDLNEQRATLGLKPLKRLPSKTKNVVQTQQIVIGAFTTTEHETNGDVVEVVDASAESVKAANEAAALLCCKAVLKSGPRKGQLCGNMSLANYGSKYCGTHYKMYNK